MNNWFTYAWERLQTTTPRFFKKLIAFGISLAGVGLALLAIDFTATPDVEVIIKKIANYFLVAGAVCTAISSLTTTDEVLSQKSNQK